MNEAPSNQTGLNDTFSSQPAPQTNPFTADLKGEFTSNFGTNTNAVSQIFKEGGFVNQNRTKYMIIGGVAIVVLAIAGYFFMSGDSSSSDDFASDDMAAEDSGATDSGDEAADDATTADDSSATSDKAATADTAKQDAATAAATAATATATASESTATAASQPAAVADSAASMGGGSIALDQPADGSSLNYDETQGPAVFSWTGGGGYIVFARNSSMHPVVMKVAVNGNSYSFHHPWPGTWYWQVQNSSGATEVRSFKVTAPVRRNVQLQQPQGGGAVAGNGGTVSWQGDSKVAYYRVEFSTGSWANPQYRFASSGNSVQLQGVTPGQYQMRVGAFSEVSGRWEYTAPTGVTVQ